jgi:hypothetical protein
MPELVVDLAGARDFRDRILQYNVKITEYETEFVKSMVKITKAHKIMEMTDAQAELYRDIEDKIASSELDSRVKD